MADQTIVPVADVGATVWTGFQGPPPLYQYINRTPFSVPYGILSGYATSVQNSYMAALGVSSIAPTAAMVGKCFLRVDAQASASSVQRMEVDLLNNGNLRFYTVFYVNPGGQATYLYYPTAAELSAITSGSDLQMRLWRLSTATLNQLLVTYAQMFIPDLSVQASATIATGELDVVPASPTILGDVQATAALAMSLGSDGSLPDVPGDVLASATLSMGFGAPGTTWQIGTVPAARRDYRSDFPTIAAPVSRRDRPADR